MRAVVQRVSHAQVSINDQIHCKIKAGVLILLGIEEGDNFNDIEWLTSKISQLRIFSDQNGQMNHSIIDRDGEILVVSQFTLFAKTKKGNRPSFTQAARPQIAIPIYNDFINQLSIKSNRRVYSGVFGADMQVQLTNDGPVTILIDTKNKE